MSRGAFLLLRLAHLLLATSGLAWAWMLWLSPAEDPYSRLPHPGEAYAQAAHLLAAPAFLLAIGLIWPQHAWSRIRAGFRPRRRSGLMLAWLLLPAAVSGYLLQVSSEPDTRAFWSVLHASASAAWLAAWLLHRAPRRAAATTGI